MASSRLFFDYGTEGIDAEYEPPHVAVMAWLLEQGYTEGVDLKMKKFEGADHSESAWRERVGEQLAWMLGET